MRNITWGGGLGFCDTTASMTSSLFSGVPSVREVHQRGFQAFFLFGVNIMDFLKLRYQIKPDN